MQNLVFQTGPHFWQNEYMASRVQIFCAFCRSPRRVYRSRRIGLAHVVASALAAGLIMAALWQEFDARVMIVFVICLAIAEVFLQIRWRMSLTCHQCGFDPVVYKKNPEAAAEKVKIHLQRRKEDPRYLLSPSLNLPLRKISADETPKSTPSQTPGRILSRQI